MDLRNLQALLGIADTGSFSAAAQAIGTVQSNVSAQVARLESELGAVLVDRGSGRLTEEGQIVVGRARRVMSELDSMVADMAALRHEVVGTVRVGVIATTGRWLVPLLFAETRARHPHLRLMVVEGTAMTLDPELVSARLELAVVSLPTDRDELIATPLFEEDLVLVVPVDHPLARGSGADPQGRESSRPPLPLAALADVDMLLPLPGTQLRDEIDGALAPAGVHLRPAMELDGVRLIASLTFDGYGLSILPASSVPWSMRERFSLVTVEGLPRRRVGVALRRRGMPSAPTRAVIDILHDVLRDPANVPEGLYPAEK